MLRARVWWFALAGLTSACGELVDFPSDPQLVAEAPPSTCRAALAPAVSQGLSTVSVRVRACDAFGDCSTPLTGLTAELCAKLDVGCSHPLTSGILDEDGVLAFEVPIADGSFDGYLAVSSASEPCTSPAFGAAGPGLCQANPACNPEQPDDACLVPLYVHALLFFNPPISAELAEPLPLTMLSSAAQPALARATGGNFDPTKGSLVLTGLDCNGGRTSGLRYSSPQGQTDVSQWYMNNGILSGTVAETDATGVGGFVGLTPGFVDIEAYDSEQARVGAVGVQVSASSVTYVSLVKAQ